MNKNTMSYSEFIATITDQGCSGSPDGEGIACGMCSANGSCFTQDKWYYEYLNQAHQRKY